MRGDETVPQEVQRGTPSEEGSTGPAAGLAVPPAERGADPGALPVAPGGGDAAGPVVGPAEGMQGPATVVDAAEPDDPDRRAAQDAAAELVRMGIDPTAVGLDAVADVHQPPVGRVRGTAPVPHRAETGFDDRQGLPIAGSAAGHRFGAAAVRYEMPPPSQSAPPDAGVEGDRSHAGFRTPAERAGSRLPRPPVEILLTRAASAPAPVQAPPQRVPPAEEGDAGTAVERPVAAGPRVTAVDEAGVAVERPAAAGPRVTAADEAGVAAERPTPPDGAELPGDDAARPCAGPDEAVLRDRSRSACDESMRLRDEAIDARDTAAQARVTAGEAVGEAARLRARAARRRDEAPRVEAAPPAQPDPMGDPAADLSPAADLPPAADLGQAADLVPAPDASPLTRPLTDRAAEAHTTPVPDDEELVEPLDEVADRYRIVLPAPWRRSIRAVTFGLLAPGAADAVQRERTLVARVRTRRREPWSVGFVAGKGGVGTTTAAAGVALTLATLRTDPVALVDAQHGTTSLGQRLAGHYAPTVAELSDRLSEPAAAPLRIRGLGVVDGAPWHGQTPRNQLVQALEELRQENAFTLVDVGDDLSELGHAALGRVDQVVLVTTPSQDAVEATRIALARIRQVEPLRLTTIVIAVVCLTSRQYRRAARRFPAEIGVPDRRVVAVPFDPALATGGPLHPADLRPATREAFVRLAGLVADAGPADDSLLALRAAVDGRTALLPLARPDRAGSA